MFKLKFGYNIGSRFVVVSRTVSGPVGYFEQMPGFPLESTIAPGNFETPEIPGQLAFHVAFHFPCGFHYSEWSVTFTHWHFSIWYRFGLRLVRQDTGRYALFMHNIPLSSPANLIVSVIHSFVDAACTNSCIWTAT